MGSSNKKKPQRTGSKKETISKILKNSELIQKNLNTNIVPTNLAAIVKAASSRQSSDSSVSGGSHSSSNSGSSASSSSSQSGSGFGIKVTLLCLLYLARFGFVMLPQHGYIMPDEFFQSTEPIAGDSLNITALRTWEFRDDFPVRSMFFPEVLYRPVIEALQNSASEPSKQSNITAYALLVGPRLVITVASLLIDLSVLKICKILYSPGQNSGIFLTAKMLDILLIHASSYLAFTYYCHTFSNTVETILFALLLHWIIDSTTTTTKGRTCPNIRIGAVLAMGFFNRPTFVLYAAVPVMTWLTLYTTNQRSKIASKNGRTGSLFGCIKNIFINSCRLIGPFTVFTILMILSDTWYYRGTDKMLELLEIRQELAFWEIVEKIKETIVLTPANFMIYNLQSKNLANHGLHPFYFHLLVNFPLMFTLLGVLWFIDIGRKSYNGRFRLNSCGINILYGSIFFVLITFSAIPHQEPRFLLGLVVPLVCLIGHQIYASTVLFTVWMLFNATLTVFYGHIHQAGVTASLFDIRATIVRSYGIHGQDRQLPDTHIIFLRQYLPPRHLLAIPSSIQDRVQIHDLSVSDFPKSFHETLTKLSHTKESANVYITGPGCLSVPFQLELSHVWSGASLSSINEYFPHFTFEDLEESLKILNDQTEDPENGRTVGMLTRLYRAFSFGVWKISWEAHDRSNDIPFGKQTESSESTDHDAVVGGAVDDGGSEATGTTVHDKMTTQNGQEKQLYDEQQST